MSNYNNQYLSNKVNGNDRNLSLRCKITVWQLAMGIYIPLPYCHIDMILENAWFSNFQKDLEWSFRNWLMVSCGQNAMSSPVGSLYLRHPKGD